MEIRIIKIPIKKEELKEMAKKQFGDLIKAVVDVEKRIMAIGPDLHSDGEVLLEKQEGSKREYVWGINLRLEEDDLVEFDSVINLKPAFNNKSRDVENIEIRKKIKEIVNNLIL
ncbi:MAG: DUF5674 family protein [Patescibacteria group bacterium]|nr:DUF5674 family protein [Patescibacteria group bacterium]